MSLTSLPFVVFFIGFSLFYWLLPSRQLKQYLLLVGSGFFCSWLNIYFFLLVIITAVISYLAALLIASYHNKKVLVFTVGLLLCNLSIFKYYNFFINSFTDLLATIGFNSESSSIKIIVPIGISFYTFQAISYVADVYTEKTKPVRNFLQIVLYLSFFPRFIAGPIVRPNVFLPQLDKNVTFSSTNFATGAKLCLHGLIYKGIFADNLSPFVDTVYSHVNHYDNTTLILATFGYYAQIYFDFAGYSLIAIGTARLLGYQIPPNFNFPYISTSIAEFWSRWHISLSTWLRDYLYIPLGGNRSGFLQENRNLMITMLLGGLWHGASWNFVFWGGLHGVGLVTLRLFNKLTPCKKIFTKQNNALGWICYILIAWLVTQLFVMLCWVPFRAENFNDSITVFEAFLFFRNDTGLKSIDPPYILLFLPIIIDTFVVNHMQIFHEQPLLRSIIHYALIGFILAICLMLLPLDVNEFIYVQF